MNKTKLKNLAEVFSGFSFRKKIENDKNGKLYVIQMRDLSDDYLAIDQQSMMKIHEEEVPARYLLKRGDILLISKGNNNKALVYDLDLPKAVAASAFFVIRPDQSQIDPYYLAWLLNQKPIQQYFNEHRAGTSTANLNIKVIFELEIPIPEKNIQRKVARINFLQQREQILTFQLQEKKRLLVSSNLMNIINAK